MRSKEVTKKREIYWKRKERASNGMEKTFPEGRKLLEDIVKVVYPDQPIRSKGTRLHTIRSLGYDLMKCLDDLEGIE